MAGGSLIFSDFQICALKDSHSFKNEDDEFMIDPPFSMKDTSPRSEEVEHH